MKVLSILVLFIALFSTQALVAQYSGELNLVIENQASIVKNNDNSRDMQFTVANLSAEKAEAIRQDLEAKSEISNVTLNNNVWAMHVEPGTSKKVLLSHFMNNDFKYITISGEKKEILRYLSH